MCPLFCLSWFALAASAILEWARLFYQVSNGIILAKELTKDEDYFYCLFISYVLDLENKNEVYTTNAWDAPKIGCLKPTSFSLKYV